MSRIGKKPIDLPGNVTVSVGSGNVVLVKGPKGELSRKIDADIAVKQEGSQILVERPTDQKRHKALHGLYRALINNMIIGVSAGFKQQLEIVGVGYKATVNNNVLELSLGYSHGLYLALPKEVVASAVTEKGKNPVVTLEGIDKELVGQMAAKIKSLRKVEPYKGKGIRNLGQAIRRKAGKTAAKK
ncbi:50S ribosomal protein L6 [Cytophagaceae bacterium DM2B3-1]|uniref:Large ribosomal subunit protein uL6 n=2 Tax=Xanthocytophaga TaxID=3078918 RepID=A0AAE3U4K2_9BACT|nr:MULTISPECIES: 50S ribosomal protein L6 [Xanthocytophaga]MDJ1466703.1 50S ribosomal protein L6 [Xanthocytophaga flavus]MDJ1479356.1 50S ribosomal protein L6 [Xanthocytophaga flavus]MDJ1492699.1 50S ribosomal protein L6 [Xanthocytophaga flavus]MDJ1500919.1 50S ribosomal protein L6 [Xanthocytophaga agilis]